METTKAKTGFWDIGYADMKVSSMGGPSLEIIEIAPMLPPGARVLDLGCGEGRNSVYLAKRGCKITAVDISENGIKKLKYMAQTLGLDITAIHGDVGTFMPTEKYDLMMAHTVLHFFPREQWRPQLARLKEMTNPGGFHSLTSIIPTAEYPVPQEIVDYGHKASFARGELDDLYPNWDIVRSDFYAKWDSHPGIPMHVHVIEKFVARNTPRQEAKPYKVRNLMRQYDFNEKSFDTVKLGMTFDEVIQICGKPADIHSVRVNDVGMGGNNSNLLAQKYEVDELLYGRVIMQVINGKLTGKYRYFTDPVSIVAET